MKKQIKIAIVTALFVLVASSLVTNASATSSIPPEGPDFIDPRSNMINSVRNKFMYFFTNMEDANFTEGDVFYDYYDIDKTITARSINESIAFDKTFSLVEFKSILDSVITKLENVNQTLYNWWTEANDTWIDTAFVNGDLVNQSYFVNKNQFVFAYISYSYRMNITEQGTSVAGFQLYTALTNPRIWYWVVNSGIAEVFDVGMDFLMYLDARFPIAVSKLLVFLKEVQDDVSTHSTVEFSYDLDVDLSKEIEIHTDIVSILLDPDKSVVNAMDAIVQNLSQSQLFTGDEILNIVNMVRAEETLSGTVTQDVNWVYEDESSPDALTKFFFELFKHGMSSRYLESQMGPFGRYLGLLRSYIGMRSIDYDSSVNGSRTNIYQSFDISQIQVKQVNFTTSENMIIKDLAFNYIEHHSLGLVIYNDTNSNGIMDLTVFEESGQQFTNTSAEILYKVDFTSAATKPVSEPNTVSDELSYGILFEDATADLRPFHDKSIDDSDLPEASISEIGFDFHYTVNRTGTPVSELKFDYVIGDWVSSDVEFENLCLSQLFMSTFTRNHLSKRVEKVTDGLGTDHIDSNSIRSNSQFRFALGDEEIGNIRLDEIPYTWNDSLEVTAYGQAIPLAFHRLVYGSHESNGEVSRTILLAAQGKSFLYSISYPVWSGESITHDPVYAVVVGAVDTSGETSINETEETGTTSGDGIVPGFELVGLIAAIPVFILARRKKK